MKTIEIQLNEYAGTCFVCQKMEQDFKYIIDTKHKLCSKKCLYDFKKHILQRYPNSLLHMIWGIVMPHSIKPKKRIAAINILADFFTEQEGMR